MRYTTPTTSSTFSPITGIREWPLRTASEVACPAVLSASIHTISVRGTITSRAGVSPNSNTDWIIRRSSSATTPRCWAMSTTSRSSISEANGPLRNPRPGVIALPISTSSRLIGASSTEIACSGSAASSAMVYAFWRPRVRGPTPIATKLTTTMMAAAATSPHPTPRRSIR